MHWLELLQPLVQIGILALAGVITRHVVTPKAHERAALLSRIASDAAALVVSLNPKAQWTQLLEATVNQIAAAAGLPTTNHDAIQRAAAAALTALGKANGSGN